MQKLIKAFKDAGFELYLVGGSVRDTLLGKTPKDFDYTTNATPDKIYQLLLVAGADAIFNLGEKFGTMSGRFGDDVVEITTYRSEEYEAGSRKPAVVFGSDLKADLARRDFTINSIAQDAFTGEIVDPFGGQDALKDREIHAVGNPFDRFTEDPLRLLRAIRLACQLNFSICDYTSKAIKQMCYKLEEISKERIAQEMNKILLCDVPSVGIEDLVNLGLMQYIIPEFMNVVSLDSNGHKNIYQHTLQVVDQTPARLNVRWAALLHDIAKPQTRKYDAEGVHFPMHEAVGAAQARSILSRLHMDNVTVQAVHKLVLMHMRVGSYDPEWTNGAVRRLVIEAGDSWQDLLDLSIADVTSKYEKNHTIARQKVEQLRERVSRLEEEAELAKIRSPLDGLELMALFNKPAGSWIKPIKDRLLELVIEGDLAQDDKEQAREIAREMMSHALSSESGI